MSAFLGPIHNWLFHKIKFQDELIKRITNLALEKGYVVALLPQVDKRYGMLEEGELADIIDESNIHGWLQDRITVVENRLAFLVTIITEENPERIMEISDAVYAFGKEHRAESGISVKEAYGYLDNLLLNGMPCDRVNDITDEAEDSITWVQTMDIHAPYWNTIHGNVDFYYAIRESLIVGILEDSEIMFQQVGNQMFQLRKEV